MQKGKEHWIKKSNWTFTGNTILRFSVKKRTKEHSHTFIYTEQLWMRLTKCTVIKRDRWLFSWISWHLLYSVLQADFVSSWFLCQWKRTTLMRNPLRTPRYSEMRNVSISSELFVNLSVRNLTNFAPNLCLNTLTEVLFTGASVFSWRSVEDQLPINQQPQDETKRRCTNLWRKQSKPQTLQKESTQCYITNEQ